MHHTFGRFFLSLLNFDSFYLNMLHYNIPMIRYNDFSSICIIKILEFVVLFTQASTFLVPHALPMAIQDPGALRLPLPFTTLAVVRF